MIIKDLFGVPSPVVKAYKPAAEGLVNPGLVIGLELETENCRVGADTYTKLLKPVNFQVTNDGSLRGVAYEFVSLPMRSDCAVGALAKYFELTAFNEGNYTDRCSVHVHVNCTDLTAEHLSTLALLYATVEEILFEFVGGHRAENIYCIPWNQCRQHLDLVNKFLANGGDVLRKWNKYTALNLIPLASYGTVEFRQMHGTSDMKKLTTWINIIGSMFKFIEQVELKELIRELKTLNSSSQYEVFFNRIFAGILPFEDRYRQKLEEGVIYAKYSLINMEKKRTKPAARVKVPDYIPPPPPDTYAAAFANVRVALGEGVAGRNNAVMQEARRAELQRRWGYHDLVGRPGAEVQVNPVPVMFDGPDAMEERG